MPGQLNLYRWLLLFLAVGFCTVVGAETAEDHRLLEIRSVTVAGVNYPIKPGRELNLGSSPHKVGFSFGAASNATREPVCVRCKLDGVDSEWNIGAGLMLLEIRYCNDAGEIVGERTFVVQGESPGWTGDFTTSPLIHRRETLAVPEGASRLWVAISSAGPASTMGIYVIDHLNIARVNGENSEIILRTPFGQPDADKVLQEGWQRDGTNPNMAKIIELGLKTKHKAFALIDDDREGHAEWHNRKEIAPRIAPGDQLVIDWDEMFNIGESKLAKITYASLPPGHFTFRVGETAIFGAPTGVETTLAVYVPYAMWEEPWFWALAALAVVVSAAATVRLITWRRLQRTIRSLRQQQIIDQERLRIARDIHDDLGARVTQISVVSAMAQADAAHSEKARLQFAQICRASDGLISALYENVWAVNPEYDNLDTTVNYICEKVTESCEQAKLRCRLQISELPKDIGISSRARHNLSMTTKEIVRNVVRHARATQVTVRIHRQNRSLAIVIEDDGCGFDSARVSPGNGLKKASRWMADIGECVVESSIGKGTTAYLKLHNVFPSREGHRQRSSPTAAC